MQGRSCGAWSSVFNFQLLIVDYIKRKRVVYVGTQRVVYVGTQRVVYVGTQHVVFVGTQRMVYVGTQRAALKKKVTAYNNLSS